MNRSFQCERCHARFPLAGVVKYGGRWVCHGCRGSRRWISRDSRLLWSVGAGIVAVVAILAGGSWSSSSPSVSAASTTSTAPVRDLGSIKLDLVADSSSTIWFTQREVTLAGSVTGTETISLVHGGDVSQYPVAEDGRFSIPLSLEPGGPQVVALHAHDSIGSELQRAIMVDAEAPEIEILQPTTDRRVTDSATFDLVVSVIDEHLLSVHANERQLRRRNDGTWVAAFLPLEDGANVFAIVARDHAGNATTSELSVHRDLGPPSLVSRVLPAESRVPYRPNITVEFEFDEVVESASFGGYPLLVEGRRASGEIPWPGVVGAWTPKLMFTDTADRSSEEEVRLDLVREAATIHLDRHVDGVVFHSGATVLLHGRVHNMWSPWLESVSSSGVSKHEIAADGGFAIEADTGAHDSIELRAEGAPDRVLVKLVRDDKPPEIEIVRPTADTRAVTASSIGLLVSVRDRAVARVHCGDQDMEPTGSDGLWRLSIALNKTGPTDIVIGAEDRAGNRSQESLTVRRDQDSPVLQRVSLVGDDQLRAGSRVRVRLAFDEPLASGELGAGIAEVRGDAIERTVRLPNQLDGWCVTYTVRDLAGNIRRGEVPRSEFDAPIRLTLKPGTRGFAELSDARQGRNSVAVPSQVVMRIESTPGFVKVRALGGSTCWIPRSAIEDS